MCGIAGVAGRSAFKDRERVPAIMKKLQHRGPDDIGYAAYSKAGVRFSRQGLPPVDSLEVMLLHLRLSILDLSDTGWQPMGTSDGQHIIVYNGETYNFIELREELEHLGCRFRSRSDTEVLLMAYSHWGLQVFPRLIGMFALAILDTQQRKLILARDCFGIKPLYYSFGQERFAFASELKALLELTWVSREINAGRLYEYLRYGISDYGGETLVSNVFQVPAGHYIEVPLDAPFQARPVCYWKPEMPIPLDISFDEAASHVRNLFLKNIRLHLRSDVMVGAALSGGIDSSSIVMAMRHVKENLDLHAFSYVAEDNSISEEQWIDVAGRASGAHVHKVRASPENLVHEMDSLIYFQDEPFGGTSTYAGYCLFREARKNGIKVMLDGQGADEVLAGYKFYIAARLASLVRQNRWCEATEFLIRCSRLPSNNIIAPIVRAADYLLPSFVNGPLRRLVGKDLSPLWMNRTWFQRHGVEPECFNRSYGTEILRENLCREVARTSLPHLLRYEDRNSMASSVESRVPFLTPELVTFLLSLPEAYLIDRHGTSKAVFRAAMREIVPDAILNRKDKIGFQTPEHKWLTSSNSWVQAVLNSAVAGSIPAFNLKEVKCEWQTILRRRANERPGVTDFRAWRWINLIQWTKEFNIRYD